MVEGGSDGRGLELAERIAATVATVWACLVDPEAVRCWFGGHMALDARPGGGFREEWSVGGRTVVTRGRVLAFDPPRRLVLSWADEDWPAETRVTIALEPEGSGTRLSLAQTGWEALGGPGAALRAAHEAGWRSHLAALRAFAEGRSAGG